MSGGKDAGQQARLGIRPQHMVLDAMGQLHGTVTLVERLGTETVLELVSRENTPFRFATPDNLDIVAGDEVRFSFDPKQAHLF